MSVYLFCHDDKPAVLRGVFAGGEGNEPVAVLGGHARIIQGKFLTFSDKGIKFFFIFRIDKIIIAVALRTVRNRLEYGDDFILCLLRERVELDALMRFIKALAVWLFQSEKIIRQSTGIPPFTALFLPCNPQIGH